jgi:hypothetical protein
MVGCGRAIAEAIEPLQRVIDTVLAAILAASAVKLYRG